MKAARTELCRSELLDYLQHIRPRLATTTYQRKLWQIEVFFKYLVGKQISPSTATRADVEEYLAGLSCSRPYRQAMCAVVREFYEYMKLLHPNVYQDKNPAADIAFMPVKQNKLPKVPSQRAMDSLFERLSVENDELHLRNRLMAELAYGSGLRRSELHRLNIEDVNPQEKTAHALGKGDKTRVVPITEAALDTMRNYLHCRRASRGPLFLSFFERRLGVTGVYEIMRHQVGIRPHLLRHACATHLLANGCGIRVIQELLGHERLTATCIYTAIEKNALRSVINRSHPCSGTKKEHLFT